MRRSLSPAARFRSIADAARARESRTRGAPEPGRPIGVLEIPRLGLSSVVIEGDEAAALLLGVGHLSDTPLPWTNGNSVFAAHRDTFFRPLEHIRRNDIIRFASAGRRSRIPRLGPRQIVDVDRR